MSPSLRRALAATALCVALAPTLPAGAQEGSAGADADAANLFTKGNELFSAGDLAGAEAAYEKAFAIQKSFDVAANLGAVKLDLGKPIEAAYLFEHALLTFPASGPGEKRRILEERLAEARSRVGTLQIEVEPSSATLQIDGERASPAPKSGGFYVSPGDHRVTASAEGFVSREVTVKVAEGSSSAVGIRLEGADAAPAPPASPVPDAAAASPGSWPTWPVFVGAGLSLALAGAGLGLTLWGASSQSDAEERRDALASSGVACPGGCEELRSLYGDADTGYNLGVGFFVAAGIATAATLVYAVLIPSSPESGALEARAGAIPTPMGPIGAVHLVGRF